MIWRFVGRFSDLLPMGQAPKQIVGNEPTRTRIILLSTTANVVRIIDKANKPINIDADGFPLPQNIPIILGEAPYGPTNEIWGTGEVGHLLYVIEEIGGPNVRKQS